MQIDLSKTEIELIDKAMQAWESEANSSAMMTSMLSAVLCPKDRQDEEKRNREADFKKAQEETQQRRITSTLLRAKLFQALNRETEFRSGSDEKQVADVLS